MSGSNPRRRHSPAVYRRRRLVVIVVFLVIVAGVVWLLVAQPWRGNAAESASPPAPRQTQAAATELPAPEDVSEPSDADPSASASASSETDAPEEPIATPAADSCIARDITVEPLADGDSYGSDQNPELSIRLTNTSEADCSLNVGTTTQVFTITSGDDTWWTSTDCQSEPSDMIVLLAAGQSVTSAAPIVWDRTRSSVDTCDDSDRPAATGGGASYHLSVEIGGISSSQPKQILLY